MNCAACTKQLDRRNRSGYCRKCINKARWHDPAFCVRERERRARRKPGATVADLRPRIVEEYQRGAVLRAIADGLGVSVRQVWAVVKSAGVSRPGGRPRIPLNGDKREDYLTLRKHFGAAYARENMGIAA